ncbi:GGDEF domain-containing protein, partial [Sulfurimonas sp. SAG-AH-194-I05]
TDYLTNILNRRAFFEIADKMSQLAFRSKKTFSILILDIDFFKKVNDTYGHLVGDDILKHLVQNVLSEIRESDVFARFGGEEFIAFLSDTDEKGAFALAEKIRISIEATPYVDDTLCIPITVSIGASEQRDEKVLASLIKRADEALYRAKDNGRNKVEIG